MCTVLFAWRAFPETPIAVGANRDESPDRPSRRPRVVEGDPSVLMPIDERAGGTWMGVNEHRLFSIVANRWTDDELGGDRSRGLLVRDVLSTESTAEAGRVIRNAIDAHEYEGFSLVVATPTAARVFVWDGSLQEVDLDPGLHVIVNVGMDGSYEIPKSRPDIGERQRRTADRLRERLDPDGMENATEWLNRTGESLGDHEVGACIHHDRYRTVSSSLVAIDERDRIDWRYAAGAPCDTAFRPVDGQI